MTDWDKAYKTSHRNAPLDPPDEGDNWGKTLIYAVIYMAVVTVATAKFVGLI